MKWIVWLMRSPKAHAFTPEQDHSAQTTGAVDAEAAGANLIQHSDDSPDAGLLCLVMLARFHRIAAEPEQLAHSLAAGGQKLSISQIIKGAKSLGLKAKLVRATSKKLQKLPLPAMIVNKDGEFLLIAKASADKVLIQDPARDAPEVLSVQELDELWSGKLILISKRAQPTLTETMFGIGWFAKAMTRYKKLFGEVILASFFLQLFALITPLVFQVVIDKVLVHRGMTTLDVLMIALVTIAIFEALLGGLRTYIFSHTTNRVDITLGSRLFDHMMALPLGYFHSRPAGQTVARVKELDSIRDFLTSSALTLVIDLFFTFVFLVVMYHYSPILTYIVLGSIPFYVILSVIITPMLQKRLEEKFQRGAANQAFLVESVSGVETLKSMAVEPLMQRRWEEQLSAYVGASFKAANLGNIGSESVGLINKITMAAILFIGAKLVIAGSLTMGQLIAFNMLAGRVAQPILRLAQLWQDFQQARISINRLGDILNTKTEPKAGPGRAALPAIKGEIRFEQIAFRYNPESPRVIDGIDINIPAGEVIGVVGSSGSGKSTLTKLIQRLFVPESGRVMIDGIDLTQVDPAWLRRQVGVVLQENILFNASVRDNIALADPAMDMDKIAAAANLAGAHDFIAQLPQGYDTIIGERGTGLSGGQRQRIAIARALATNPRILILDEATSALDLESEAAIQANMREITKGRTVIIIAHRLAAVRNCDRTLVLEKGQLVEQGCHDELLAINGRYAELHAHQAGDFQANTKENPKRPASSGISMRLATTQATATASAGQKMNQGNAALRSQANV